MRFVTPCVVFIILAVSVVQLHAQPDTLWATRINTTGNPAIYSAMVHSSGDFILIGETNPGLANSNVLIARINPAGAIDWIRSYGTANNDAGYSMVELPNGDIVIAGSGSGGAAALLLAVSPAGDSLWSRSYRSPGTTAAYDITLLHDGTLAVVGMRAGADIVHSDLWLLECNVQGDTLWTRSFGGTDSDIGMRLSEQSDRTLSLSGYSRSGSTGDYDLWMLRTDSTGTLLSSSLWGGTGPDMCYDRTDGNGDTYMVGKTTVSGRNYGYGARIDSNGDSLWIRRYSANGTEEQFRGVAARRTGGILCAGWTGISWNNRQCWLVAIAADGTEEWHWIHGPVGSGFYGILRLPDGGYLAYGQITELNTRKGYAARIFISEMRGTVLDAANSTPVANAHIQVLGGTASAVTDLSGRFRIGITHGSYDLIVSGDCLSRDTLRGLVVPPDSIGTITIRVGHPVYAQSHTSINAVIHQNVRTSVPIKISNSGTGPMEVGLSAQPVRPTGPWLSVDPETALIAAGDTLTVIVGFSADSSENRYSDFYGNIVITTNSCPDSALIIPVTAYALDVNPPSPDIPLHYSMSAYPNPFNAQTSLVLAVPRLSMLTVALYDITGRLVRVVSDNRFAAGTYRFPLDAGSLPSGVYIVRAEGTDVTSTQKILLLK